MPAEKIAITLDEDLLARVEARRRQTRESRSAFIARAVRQLLDDERRRARIAEYVAAYERAPESPAEVEAASLMANEALAALAWDEDD